eukprot:6997450-Pyramimonas_sp.AAC.2
MVPRENTAQCALKAAQCALRVCMYIRIKRNALSEGERNALSLQPFRLNGRRWRLRGCAARPQQWQTIYASSARRASRTSPTRASVLDALTSSTSIASRNTRRPETAQCSRRHSARS